MGTEGTLTNLRKPEKRNPTTTFVHVENRWKKTKDTELQREQQTSPIVTITSSKLRNQSISLQPAVTTTLNDTTITLTSLTMPPTPTLASKFISDGTHLALWNSEGKLNLVCDSKDSAASLNCMVNTDCECQPAESKNEVENRFPVLRPWITFKPSEHDSTIPTAYVPALTTAEFIIHTKERFNKVVTDVTDSVCRVNNAIAKGCYQCPQGAESKIVCTTDGRPVMASIRCDDTHFTVPCSPEGTESTLRFVHTLARMRKVCDVNCGSTTTTFEITGILQWTRTIHGSAKKILGRAMEQPATTPQLMGKKKRDASHSDDSVSSVHILHDSKKVADVAPKETKKSLPKPPKLPGKTQSDNPQTKRRPSTDDTLQGPSSAKKPRTQILSMKELLREGGTLLLNAAENMDVLTRQ
ncbi:hypothetical protein OSTOST_16157, partial [Ostertagia ostertagi]